MSRMQNMTLKQKGPVVPPVRLEGPAQIASRLVQAMDDVISATHWEIGDTTAPNGADFYLGDRELGHIHLDGEAHLPVTKKIASWLIDHDLADEFPYSDAWITYQIDSKKSAQFCAQLFALNHARVCGESPSQLRARMLALSGVRR